MSKQKGLILSVVFLIAAFFFWTAMNRFPRLPRAADVPVSVFFEKSDISVGADQYIEVNVMLGSGINNTISAATVMLDYSNYVNIIEFDKTKSDAVNSACQNSGFALTSLVDVYDDTQSGKAMISRALVDPDTSNLPKGTFCFTTFYFKAKSGLSGFPKQASVVFDNNEDSCQIVGPGKTYVCQYLDTINNIVNIEISQGAELSEQQKCEADPIGNWQEFPNSCVDLCSLKQSGTVCAEVMTYGCNCGEGRCWDADKCTEEQLVATPTIPISTPSGVITSTITQIPSCINNDIGNCTCDSQGIVDMMDFNCWRVQFFGTAPCSTADFNGDGSCDLIDFNIWRSGFFIQQNIITPVVTGGDIEMPIIINGTE